ATSRLAGWLPTAATTFTPCSSLSTEVARLRWRRGSWRHLMRPRAHDPRQGDLGGEGRRPRLGPLARATRGQRRGARPRRRGAPPAAPAGPGPPGAPPPPPASPPARRGRGPPPPAQPRRPPA